MPIPAHGGELVNLIIAGKEREELFSKGRQLKNKVLNQREVSDLEMLAVGAFSPLSGFLLRDDYLSVLESKRLTNGIIWTIPVTLSCTKEEAKNYQEGEEISLLDENQRLLAILKLEEKYSYDQEKEAEEVYRTKEREHPGVAYLYQRGNFLLGGSIRLINRPAHSNFQEYRFDPAQTREIFKKRGWKRIVGFQTRNPIHRAHEYIQKCALEIVDGLFLHPLTGETKRDDLSAEIRMESYKVIFEEYYPKERAMIAIFPAAMRYAGPREAVFHALVRKNYGCTHFIVGRDHAGAKNYYGSFDAHYIFDEFTPEELGITPLFFDYTFYCQKCGNMASYKTCAHPAEEHISLSGTKVREMLKKGQIPPPEITRPEVARLLIRGITNS